MNKIVCDVCATSYPETETQCPICGTAKTDANKSTAGGQTGYAYVKGGRFSHANVRKRNEGKQELPRVVMPAKQKAESAGTTRTPAGQGEEAPAPKKKSGNWILALIAILLVSGIVALSVYIVKDFVDSQRDTRPSDPVGSTQSTAPTNKGVPCTGLRLALSEKTFTALSEKFHLSVIVTPANTTDEVRYSSSDETIALVDEKGVVTPVADGTAIIYVYCGEFTVECSITCNVGVAPETPTQPTDPTDPTEPEVELVLNREDFTLNGYGSSHILYSGELDPAQITWSSSDETVAIVQNGKVIAVGNGNATITAEYKGQKATCKVHCTNVVVSNYELQTIYGKASDFTISVGDIITLYMVNKDSGLRIQASELQFSLSKEGVITIDENGKIKALATGSVTVTVTYGDQTLKAKVHVKKAS